MKIGITVLILFVTANLFAQAKHDLIVTTTGYKNKTGNIFISVYNSEGNYMNVSKASYLGIVKATNGKTSYTFKNIPDAVYAVSLFFDENKNGKLDKNFFGIPTEKYGFSNNAKGFFGPPKFSKAKFEHHADQEIIISLE